MPATIWRRPVVALFLFVTLAGASATRAEDAARLVELLRGGGYNLYMRHAATDWSQGDSIAAHGDWVSCDPGKVRQLSDAGRRDARALGRALRALSIPLGRVFASPYCRTMETARLVSGRDPEPTVDVMNLRSADFVGGRDAVVARARKRLSGAPSPGVNDLYAAHGNLGRAAIGESLGEGELVVIAPRGGGSFDIVGTLTAASLEALSSE